MAQVVKDINFKTKVTGTGAAKSKIQGVEKTAVNSANKMSASFKKMGGILGAAFGTQQILSFVLTTKNAARDAEEIRSKFEQVFSGIRIDALNMAKDFSASFRLANTSTLELLGNTGDLLVGFGFTEKAALDMSVEINRLAQDLASFQNVDVTSASIALTKALLGETESAKSLGIVIRQNTKEFRANVEAIMKTQGVTIQQAKSIEILRIAYQQSGKAVGDFERTIDSLANQEKILAERFKEINEEIGRGFIPSFQNAIEILNVFNSIAGGENGALFYLTRLSAVIAAWPVEMFGVISDFFSGDTFKPVDIGKGIDNPMFIFTEEAGSNLGGLTDGLKGVTTEVKKLNDELELANMRLQGITTGFEGGGGGGAGAGIGTGQTGRGFGEAGLLGGPGQQISAATEAGLKEGFDKSKRMMEGVGTAWASTLHTSFNQFWDETFGYANSLLEQLLKATASSLFGSLLGIGLNFLTGGFGGGLAGMALAPRSGGGRAGTSEVIVLQIGNENIGTFVRKGNEFNRMRRLN